MKICRKHWGYCKMLKNVFGNGKLDSVNNFNYISVISSTFQRKRSGAIIMTRRRRWTFLISAFSSDNIQALDFKIDVIKERNFKRTNFVNLSQTKSNKVFNFNLILQFLMLPRDLSFHCIYTSQQQVSSAV
jgi:hypothetical protein